MYPEVVRAADRWLDSSAGRSSPFAATLRQADGNGYARASPWCPGMASPDDGSAASEDRGMAPEHRSLAPKGSGAASEEYGMALEHRSLAPKDSGMASPEDGSAAPESARPPPERIALESSTSREESSAVPEQHAHSGSSAPVTGVIYSIQTGLALICAACGSACVSGWTVAQPPQCPEGGRM